MADHREVIAYARRVQEERPQTTSEEMRKFLKMKFAHDEDILKLAQAEGVGLGLVADPFSFYRSAFKILKGMSRAILQQERNGLDEIIDGVLEIMVDASVCKAGAGD